MAFLWGKNGKSVKGCSLMFDVDSLEGDKQKGFQ